MRPENRNRSWLLSLLMTMGLALPAMAEPLAPRVAAAQTPDLAMVEIVLTSGEKVEGRLYGVTREGVTVIPGKQAQAIAPVIVKFDDMKSFKQRPAVFKNFLAGFGVVVTFGVMASAVALGM
ncbi:MAG: hypothetical protein IH602_20200 [Bryobacteraceae bacterium]|nr:hypothetical protein [Bryobacteraceae bacterium]